ncbi:MAG: hypothetical protein Q7S38_01285 [bacterium]|nr:hypothetical protein [bacterium]
MNGGKERLGDVTALAGVGGEWTVGQLELLPEPLQKMTQTVESWFDPSQGWHLTTHRDKVRIAQSSRTPDLHTIQFYYDATNPPIAKDSLCRSCDSPYPGDIDLLRVFRPELKDGNKVFLWSNGIGKNAAIRGIESVGPVNQDSLSGILVSVDLSDPRWQSGQHKFPRRLVVRVGVKIPNTHVLDEAA